jgi:hypothetical protein
MSKLSTLLRRASRPEPAPMGFAAASSRAKTAEMLICVLLPGPDAEAAGAAVKAGADFVLVASSDVSGDAEKIKALISAVSVPCGLRLDRPSPETVAEARALGLDWLWVADLDTQAASFVDDEIGFVLAVTDDATDSALQVLGSTSFDALYAGELAGSLTLRRQLALRRVASLTRKPLLLDVRDPLTGQDLECLRDSGVAGLISEVKGRSSSRVAALRQAVGTMHARRKPRNDRDTTALLPSVSRGGEGGGDDDDE